MTDARSQARVALLPDRGVVSVSGSDAAKLLQGIITADMTRLDAPGAGHRPPALHGALLSPQGKVLFEFFVVRLLERGHSLGTTYAVEVARDKSAELAKRLAMYRLRADVRIEDVSADIDVYALWGTPPQALQALPPVGFDVSPSHWDDPRHPALGMRWLAWRTVHEQAADRLLAAHTGTAADYHAHRIALGVPEGGRDWDFGDAFPHEADLDLFHGVSFEKGCYVGQEIVARMQHRGTVRKRVARVTGERELPATRPDVRIGDVVIGRLGSVAGRQGLAMVRLDRAIEAIDKGQAITADGMAIEVDAEMIAGQRALMAAKVAAP